MAKTVNYKGMEIEVPDIKPLKILAWTAGGIAAIVLGRKIFKRKVKLPTKNKTYKDPLLINITGGATAWSPTPLAKELYTAMNGNNYTGRGFVLNKLDRIVDPLKVKAVYYEYNSIANANGDNMNLVQRIRDEFIFDPIKARVLTKLDTLGLG